MDVCGCPKGMKKIAVFVVNLQFISKCNTIHNIRYAMLCCCNSWNDCIPFHNPNSNEYVFLIWHHFVKGKRQDCIHHHFKRFSLHHPFYHVVGENRCQLFCFNASYLFGDVFCRDVWLTGSFVMTTFTTTAHSWVLCHNYYYMYIASWSMGSFIMTYLTFTADCMMESSVVKYTLYW